MTKKGFTYLIFILSIVFVLYSCREAKYVQEGEYLYKVKKRSFPWNHHKRTIHFVSVGKDSSKEFSKSDDLVFAGDLYSIIRPQPNRVVKLLFYNSIDTVKMNAQVARKRTRIEGKNFDRIAKENRINKERNDKAHLKGESTFFQKKVRRKKMRTGWRYWIVNKVGEAPVIADSVLTQKSVKQIEIFLEKKGFYNSKVTDTTVYNVKKRKAYNRFTVFTGEPYRIGVVRFDTLPEYSRFNKEYTLFLRKNGAEINRGDLFDADKLDNERERFTKYLRDRAYFDLNKNYIFYSVDTLNKNHVVDVYIKMKPKMIDNPDGSEVQIKLGHKSYKINAVTYFLENKDSLSFKNFPLYKERLKKLGLSYTANSFPLLDTLVFIDTNYYKKVGYEKLRACWGPKVDTLIVHKGVFIYNEEMIINPYLLDRQNFLEINNADYKRGDNGWYKEYYVERSYRRLLGLGVFESITPNVYIDPLQPLGNKIQVEYHLKPSKKQLFLIEPRATNSNGFLGVSATVSYTSKNLLGGAEKLKVSFSGGLESQPAVFDNSASGTGELLQSRTLNTFELSPKISLEFPKLFPLPRCLQRTLSKRLYPTTVFDGSYNFQRRDDFDRSITELGYSWKFKEGKSKTRSIKWQSLNFVKLKKDPFFEQKLAELNDPFILNSYSDHFSNKFQFTLVRNTQRVQSEKGKSNYMFVTTKATTSGFVLDNIGVGVNDTIEGGIKRFFGVPFTQFLALETDARFYMKIGRTRSMAFRLLGGIGYAYGNSPSLPYEQSFYAGGSNDLRAWEARTVAQGGTQTWDDTLSTTTQIGDMKMELNIEYRFQLSSMLKMAWFIDAGNIWKLKDDPKSITDDLAVFRLNTFVNQIAVGGGFGLRLDFDFFLIRLDAAIPIHNPYMHAGERWIWEDRNQYDVDLLTKPDWYTKSLSNPFSPRINIGIGYPF